MGRLARLATLHCSVGIGPFDLKNIVQIVKARQNEDGVRVRHLSTLIICGMTKWEERALDSTELDGLVPNLFFKDSSVRIFTQTLSIFTVTDCTNISPFSTVGVGFYLRARFEGGCY